MDEKDRIAINKLIEYYDPENIKAPFGNGRIEMNIAEILDWELYGDVVGELILSMEQFYEARRLYKLFVEFLAKEP